MSVQLDKDIEAVSGKNDTSRLTSPEEWKKKFGGQRYFFQLQTTVMHRKDGVTEERLRVIRENFIAIRV